MAVKRRADGAGPEDAAGGSKRRATGAAPDMASAAAAAASAADGSAGAPNGSASDYTSLTAKKILETLELMSSPLSVRANQAPSRHLLRRLHG